MNYTRFPYQTNRRKTREVMVGPVGVGGDNPIRAQSMTNSNTRDVEATADQIMRLADSGCEIARVTVQGIKEAEACEAIKNILIQKDYTIPVVADIHFYPPAAMRVIEYVDKVRINPGNFVDKRASFQVLEYDDETYAQELLKIEEKFTPLVLKCKSLGKAMRIGTNHGSLSDRIMNRYGDTPEGMVESALEFTRVCRDNDFHDLIFSMKASNPMVMIQAYRLLVARFDALGWDYPLHLGVTEAGEGEDGRVKSAIGIGSLLLDGIGDTVRVSLTEDPWLEIDPCNRIVSLATQFAGVGIEPFEEKHRNFMEIEKRSLKVEERSPLHSDASVILTVKGEDLINQPVEKDDTSPDLLFLSDAEELSDDQRLQVIDTQKQGAPLMVPGDCISQFPGAVALYTIEEAVKASETQEKADRFVADVAKADDQQFAVMVGDDAVDEWEEVKALSPSFIILSPSGSHIHFVRKFSDWAKENQVNVPIILNFIYSENVDDFVIRASAECGSLLCDKLAEGVWLEADADRDMIRNLSFNILQGSRMRTTKTEFISCPSCGRTLFDLQEVSARIRDRTNHLPGVKIAIMGCIVNGPGEMADADFGYVGSRPGMIDLYVGKECVERNIPFEEGDDRLVDLIKAHGKWIEPVEVSEPALT